MNVKKLIMWVGFAVATVVVGLAIVNRAKRQFPTVGKVLGE